MQENRATFVHVWHITWDRLTEDKRRTWMGQLSDDEKSKVERFVYDSDRDRYLVSHGFCRSVLGIYLHREPKEIQFGEEENNKPIVQTENRPPIHFNLSHSMNAAVVAVSNRPVGIDIEYLNPTLPFEEMIPQFMSEHEKSVFLRLSSSQQVKAFYCCWTRKEAYVKALGQGLSYPIKEITVSMTEGSITAWKDDYQPNEPKRWKMDHIGYIPSYVGAVVHQGDQIVNKKKSSQWLL